MLKNKAKLKGLIGILLIVIAAGTIYFWENYGRQEFTYTNIIVFKEDVDENTIVKKEMLGIMQVEKSTVIEDVIKDPNKIIGKETTTFIPSKLPLSEKFFISPELATGIGKYTFKIPSNWIYSYPDTLRRGDRVYIYPINSAFLDESYDGGMYDIYDSSKPLVEVTVAYVKDSSNREVINVGTNRYDASASVAQIEIITDENIYNKLRNAYEAGYMFNLMYE